MGCPAPQTFKPGIFKKTKLVDTHKLLPFGMGSPGTGLAHKCFHWENIDINEGARKTLLKVKTSEAILDFRWNKSGLNKKFYSSYYI